MDKLYTSKGYIYESPDGGSTVYQRAIGGSTDRTLVGSNMTPRFDPMDANRFQISYSEFCEIMRQAEMHSTLKQCFEQLLATYNLVKKHD